MFDIGFSEIVLIAVVALVVVGPREFPALIRNIGSWLGKTRQFMNAVKTEFDREINKADEIKRLLAKEVEIAELHKNLDVDRRADRPAAPAADRPRIPDPQTSAPPLITGDGQVPAAKQDNGPPQA
jgi:sec-independent protein translocase protein TatB